MCKMFNIPINDDRIQSMTEEQIDLMIWSDLLDHPEVLKKMDNRYYDPDFDEEEDDEDDLPESHQKNVNSSQIKEFDSLLDKSSDEHKSDQISHKNDINKLATNIPDDKTSSISSEEWEDVE